MQQCRFTGISDHGDDQQNSVINISGAKEQPQSRENSRVKQNVNKREEGHLSIITIDLLRFVPYRASTPIPSRNSNRAIDELSRRNELRNAFLDSFRWLEPFEENIFQSGQHFCCSSPSELCQS